MANPVFSISHPRCLFFSGNQNSSTWIHHPSSTSSIRTPSKHSSLSFCSYSPSSSSVVEDDPPADEDLTFSGCKACGNEKIESGCNGDGRIQGGIATVPGFGWWPIKAYRPCPAFLAAGGRYQRTGQSMDEVAFGRGQQSKTPSRTLQEDDSQQEEAKS
ncbi:PREDICTED: uncharacterized protein LOC104817582 isoform X2 [Tarenaya hassleriana]|uniref:uncharacterized protein LOC104817582 isoform X2 n=1 Tax=Tarenaya hassleriana TaxID=28532 RepID=UPI00053C08A4|nr:PREDICTED: uncharacterized protein LOC104817582 isoform X2 [Tarenaya hassleriana]